MPILLLATFQKFTFPYSKDTTSLELALKLNQFSVQTLLLHWYIQAPVQYMSLQSDLHQCKYYLGINSIHRLQCSFHNAILVTDIVRIWAHNTVLTNISDMPGLSGDIVIAPSLSCESASLLRWGRSHTELDELMPTKWPPGGTHYNIDSSNEHLRVLECRRLASVRRTLDPS